MNPVLFIAIKEISKHKLKTSLIVFAVSLGVISMVVADAFMKGMGDEFKVKTIDIWTSHIQVLPQEEKDYVEKAESKKRMIERIPGVSGVSLRVEDQILMSSEKKRKEAQLLAVEPKSEQTVTFLHENITFGEFLRDNDKNKVILGERLADDLGVNVGETVSIVFSNGISRNFKVVGLFRSGFYEFDTAFAVIPYEDALLSLGKRNVASSIVVRLEDEEKTEKTVMRIKQIIPQDDVKSWKELAWYVELLLQVQEIMNIMVLSMILITAGFSMTSAMVIKVSGRIKYIGMMKSIGARKDFILKNYLLQAALIGLFGGILGDILGYLTVLEWKAREIVIEGAEEVYGVASFPVKLEPQIFVYGLIFAVIVCSLSALYPAWKASKLDVVEAVRHA